MKNTPTVSVMMPLYNTNPEYLRRSIESILIQTFKDFEFLILNDSPNNKELEKIVKSYDDPRIIYAENENNLGIALSRNKLIEMSHGKYLAVFDHDDVSIPDRLKKQVEYLDANPLVGVCSSRVGILRDGNTDVGRVPENNLDIKCGLMWGNAVPHTSIMFRKSVLDETGVRYESKYSPAEDYMICIRLIEHTMFYNIQDTLVLWRDHGENTTYTRSEKMRDAAAMIQCIAYQLYPYLANMQERKKIWLRLFFVIPFIKIKMENNRVKCWLFGFIPLIYKK
jgi:glycosyltransferase involved in cell wall biosynthesis